MVASGEWHAATRLRRKVFVLNTQCKLDCVERTAVSTPLGCLEIGCEEWHDRDHISERRLALSTTDALRPRSEHTMRA